MSQRLFVQVSLSKQLAAGAAAAVAASATATAGLSIRGRVRRMTNTASPVGSLSATSVKP